MSVFSSVTNIFELVLVEQIFTDLTNLKLKFDVGAKPTMSENENLFERDVEGLGTIHLLL